jgi:hypothetical protein
MKLVHGRSGKMMVVVGLAALLVLAVSGAALAAGSQHRAAGSGSGVCVETGAQPQSGQAAGRTPATAATQGDQTRQQLRDGSGTGSQAGQANQGQVRGQVQSGAQDQTRQRLQDQSCGADCTGVTTGAATQARNGQNR